MSLPRKEVRFYLDHDTHARLKRLCDVDELELAAYVEGKIQALVDREFHRAFSLLGRDSGGSGKSRKSPESRGTNSGTEGEGA